MFHTESTTFSSCTTPCSRAVLLVSSMRSAKPSPCSDVAAAFSRAGHFVSGMLQTDLASSLCVGLTAIYCADPVRTVLSTDGRPWIARRVATWLAAVPPDPTVRTTIATFLDSIRCAVFCFTLAICSMSFAQATYYCLGSAAFDGAQFPAVFFTESSGNDLVGAASN